MRQVALPLEGDYWSQHGRWQCGAAGYRELWRRGYFANLIVFDKIL